MGGIIHPPHHHRRVAWDGSYITYGLERHLSTIGKFFELNDNTTLEGNAVVNLLVKTPDCPYLCSLYAGLTLRVSCTDNIELSMYEAPNVLDEGESIAVYNKHRGKKDIEPLLSFYQNCSWEEQESTIKLFSVMVHQFERVPLEWTLIGNSYYVFTFKRLRTVVKPIKAQPFYLYVEFYEEVIDEEEVQKFLD